MLDGLSGLSGLSGSLWFLNIFHPRWLWVTHFHTRHFMHYALILIIVIGFIFSLAVGLMTANHQLSAVVFLFSIITSIMCLLYFAWAERLFHSVAVRGLIHNRTVAEIRMDHAAADDELRAGIECYCAMMVYTDLRFRNEVISLSHWDGLLLISEFRERIKFEKLDADQAQSMVRELAKFVFESGLYDDWVIVGTHPT